MASLSGRPQASAGKKESHRRARIGRRWLELATLLASPLREARPRVESWFSQRGQVALRQRVEARQRRSESLLLRRRRRVRSQSENPGRDMFWLVLGYSIRCWLTAASTISVGKKLLAGEARSRVPRVYVSPNRFKPHSLGRWRAAVDMVQPGQRRTMPLGMLAVAGRSSGTMHTMSPAALRLGRTDRS